MNINQIVFKFKATDNWDIMWIFPEPVVEPSNGLTAYLNFANPELIDITNFSAGPSPITTPSNCTATLGANPPNCSVANSVFIWEDPNGNLIFPTSAGQQTTTVNTSSAYGNYKLKMQFPGAIQPLNNCSGIYADVEASVYVPQCGTTCIPPQITANVPGNYTDMWFGPGPNNDQVICSCYDCEHPVNLTANTSSPVQWYQNGVAIQGGWYEGNSNPLPLNLNTLFQVQSFTYTVKNLTTECMSNPITITFLPTPHIFVTYTNTIPKTYTAYTFDYGGSTNYTWNVQDPNVIYLTTPLNQKSIQFTFPSGYSPTPYWSTYGYINTLITLNVTNSPYSCANNFNKTSGFFVNRPNATTPSILSNEFSLYPNPANNNVNFNFGRHKAKTIEIYSLDGM